jgi:hypothetical protein
MTAEDDFFVLKASGDGSLSRKIAFGLDLVDG